MQDNSCLKELQGCTLCEHRCGADRIFFSGGEAGIHALAGHEMIWTGRPLEARLAGTYAVNAGCRSVPRDCRQCGHNRTCGIKAYVPGREP